MAGGNGMRPDQVWDAYLRDGVDMLAPLIAAVGQTSHVGELMRWQVHGLVSEYAWSRHVLGSLGVESSRMWPEVRDRVVERNSPDGVKLGDRLVMVLATEAGVSVAEMTHLIESSPWTCPYRDMDDAGLVRLSQIIGVGPIPHPLATDREPVSLHRVVQQARAAMSLTVQRAGRYGVDVWSVPACDRMAMLGLLGAHQLHRQGLAALDMLLGWPPGSARPA